ncbi:unnamed protein product [Dovyalis caffra]|uniref:Ribosomal protein S19 n=1 Tax=Dovyalis caffra TaxID=77055 RepID=A0AAV1R9I2_9ROSI|nr:unnamed protein product [Dovyalis caffra]
MPEIFNNMIKRGWNRRNSRFTIRTVPVKFDSLGSIIALSHVLRKRRFHRLLLGSTLRSFIMIDALKWSRSLQQFARKRPLGSHARGPTKKRSRSQNSQSSGVFPKMMV